MDKKSGFTLIELLVVIAIIAILAAILFPVFAAAKNRAHTTRCLNNLKQLSNAINLYASDNGGLYPFVGEDKQVEKTNWCGDLIGGAVEWCYPERGQIWTYTKSRDLYLCPSDRKRPALEIRNPPPGLSIKDFPLSYSMNVIVAKRNPDSIGLRPSKLLLLIHETRDEIDDGYFAPDTGNAADIPDRVHYDGTCISYCDGHARWASQKQLLEERDAGYWGKRK